MILKDIEGLFFSTIDKKDALRSKRQTYSIPFSRYVFWMLFWMLFLGIPRSEQSGCKNFSLQDQSHASCKGIGQESIVE